MVMKKEELNFKIKGLGDYGLTGDSIEFGPLLITCFTQNKKEIPHYYVYGENDESENGIFNSANSEKVVEFIFNYNK
jgi:hypothetical protein